MVAEYRPGAVIPGILDRDRPAFAGNHLADEHQQLLNACADDDLLRLAVDSPRLMKWISIVAGWSLIGFGIYFGYSAIQQTVLLLRG
ncbi:hypothetical protein ABU162_18250 [Paenibacillus thiaminolyticus]|uniref:hypothetical protein n=1 Tax=Paenibacillus thiaminolyticus TaxID=49283 RepID=UPI0035A57A6B